MKPLICLLISLCLCGCAASEEASADAASSLTLTEAEEEEARREAEEQRIAQEEERIRSTGRQLLESFAGAHPEEGALLTEGARIGEERAFFVHAPYRSRFETKDALRALESFSAYAAAQSADIPLCYSIDLRPDGAGGFAMLWDENASNLGGYVLSTDHVFTHNEDNGQIVVNGDLGATQEELDTLLKTLRDYPPRISFKAVSVDGTRGISYNSTLGYFSACTIKGPYLYYCYRALMESGADLEEQMIYEQQHYNGGTGSIRQSPPGTAFTTRDVLYRTAWESDNTGYKMLYYRFGNEGYNEMIDTQMGCHSLRLDGGIWSAHGVNCEDYIIAWSAIYDFLQEDNIYAKAFLDSLSPCEYSFFGQELTECTISQKYGQETTIFGATGIIRTEGKPDYLFSLLVGTEGTTDYDKQMINSVIRQVHELMIRV